MVDIDLSEYIDLCIEAEKATILLDAIFEEASINFDKTGIVLDIDSSQYMFGVIKALYPGIYAVELKRCREEAERNARD